MAANVLKKTIKQTYIPGAPGIPARPGRPGTPARTVTVTETACGYRPINSSEQSGSFVKNEKGGYSDRAVWVPSGESRGGSAYEYACAKVTRQQTIPGDPGIPAQPAVPALASKVEQDFNLGWNARGRSRAEFPSGVRATFKADRTVTGAVVGLNTRYSVTGYADIKFAFYLSHGIAKVMEAGAVQATVGPFASGAEFRVERANGKVTYFIDGAQVWQSNNDAAPMFLDAALYTGGDSVYDPSIAPLSSGIASFEPLQAAGSDAPYCYAALSLHPMAGGGSEIRRSVGVFEPLRAMGGDYAYGGAICTLQPLEGLGAAEALRPSLAICDGVLPLLTGVGSGLSGTIGGSTSQFEPLLGIASDRPYGAVSAAFEPMYGYGRELDDAERSLIVMFSGSHVRSEMEPAGVLVLTFTSSMTAASLITFDYRSYLEVFSSASVDTPFAAASYVALEIISTATSTALYGMLGSPSDVWVVNVDTGATSRYEAFDFNSFAEIDGHYFGCRADGIYELEGDTDDGDPIRAMVSFGKQDFGTSALKRITNAYVGVSSTGKLVLKVIADGAEYDYVARDSSEYMQTQRFDTGRGLRLNQLEFELYNQDGDDFELSSVEFAVLTTERRI